MPVVCIVSASFLASLKMKNDINFLDGPKDIPLLRANRSGFVDLIGTDWLSSALDDSISLANDSLLLLHR